MNGLKLVKIILIYNLLLCGAPQLILSRYRSRPHVCFASNVINITLCPLLLVLVPVRALVPVANSSHLSLELLGPRLSGAETPGSRKLVAWRDKLLIKGLVHSASEYFVVGTAAQPAQGFVPDCTASTRDGVLGAVQPQAQRTGEEWGPWGAVSVGSCPSQLCWRLDVSMGLLQHRGTSPGQEHQPLRLEQK